MGATLGKYELLRRIGQGGMAELYLARARSIGGFERLFVIKRLLPELATDAAFVKMFLDEARIAAQLHHANIGQVHDVDSADGAVFYTMEYLRGHDLQHIVQTLRAPERAFPLDSAIAIGLAICAGLHHAHQLAGADGELLNLVHRDVSPHNVIVTFDGSVKIIDFGIAKIAGAPSATRGGALRGKFRYMSPEQVLAQALDGRSDVFATAIVLYELTTGTRLFDYFEYDALRAIVYSDVPPPTKVRSDFPPALETILLRGLARDRAARYPNALAMQHALEAFAREQDLDVSALALSRFMESVYPDEAAQSTRPVLETLRPDTGLWALGAVTDTLEDTSQPPSDATVETVTLGQPTATAAPRARRVARIAIATLVALGAAAGIAVWWSADRVPEAAVPIAPSAISSEPARVPPPTIAPPPAATPAAEAAPPRTTASTLVPPTPRARGKAAAAKRPAPPATAGSNAQRASATPPPPDRATLPDPDALLPH